MPRQDGKASRILASWTPEPPQVAGKIVEHRPYTSTRDLVRKRVLSSAEFDRVKGQIFVK
jgi:hypothetical protein